ncbi:DYW domain [Dillenia turbinata]|uniref:DYW domain n=1 Tax=Dillenia turbinata TaxID=194707 RepID=A0AAN8Z4U3_9MAGN
MQKKGRFCKSLAFSKALMVPMLVAPINQFTLESKVTQTLTLLEKCSNMEELKQIHSQMFKTGLVHDTIPASRLLAFCCSPDSGCLDYARKVFDRIQDPNTFIWNMMIRGFSNSKYPEEALILYHQMLCCSVPHNAYTFPFLLKACSSLSALEETQQIHTHVIKRGFASEVYSANSLLHVYATCGCMKFAYLIYDQLSTPDIVSGNSMIDGYSECGEMDLAYEIFKQMPAKNIVSWTTMISGYVGAGMYMEALNLFNEMQTLGIEPDKVVLSSVLSACANLGALDQGRWIHCYIDNRGLQIDQILGCALIDMYAKCGDVEEAVKVFEKMKKGIPVWTPMIVGLAIHGRAREALNLFVEMLEEGIKPNPITFTGILTACSYGGLVNEGKNLFHSMQRHHGLKPRIEHYGCMVHLLGRAGFLQEAKELIKKMPMKPNAAIWGALLHACQIHRNLELGKQIGKILIEADPGKGSRYIQLSSVYARRGEWDEAAEVRKVMKTLRVSKLPGCSALYLNGNVHEFITGDWNHPQMEVIYHTWDQIAESLKQEGYEPAIGDLLLDLQDEEKEMAINQHSEKLAITFGLISTEPGMTLRIVNNQRVCQDCHTAAKLISKVYARKIVLRDRNRFHHFENGKCSCEDYW